MPHIVAVANQKGGVGKTTTSTNIACYLHKADESVLFIDQDPQRNATVWSLKSEKEDTFPIVQMGKNLARDLPRLSRGYDWVIIDGGSGISDLAAAIIKVADMVIIPTTPSPYDYWAAEDFIDLIKIRQEVTNGKPKAAWLATMVIKNTNLSKEVEDDLAKFELPIFKTRTTRSVVYAETAKNGGSTADLKDDHPASMETAQIVKELREFLNEK